MLRLNATSRLPSTHRWLVALYVAWGLGVCVIFLAGRHLGLAFNLCPLRTITGVPCPFCGGTRAALSLVSLDPIGALATNPMVATALPLLALALGARLLTARTVTIDIPPESHRRLRAAMLTAARAALVLNWIYVVATLPATHA